MTLPASQRPVWKRKRWIAAAVVWLVVVYPLSAGPVFYATVRGWFPYSCYAGYCAPAHALGYAVCGEYYGAYLGWWWDVSGARFQK